MKISKRCDYGLRSLIYLGSFEEGKRVINGEELAQKLDIPLKFLFTILLELKKAGFLQTYKGRGGGFVLKKNPNDVLFLDVVKALDGDIYDYEIMFTEKSTNESVNTSQVIKETLFQAKQVLLGGLQTATLKELCASYKRLAKEDADYSI